MTVELAELVESVAPGCAEAIQDGQSNVTQYPAADLSQAEAAEFYGVVEAESCFGLFPGVFLLVFESPDSRVYTTVASAWLGCVLGWTDTVQYVYGPDWIIDAPYWEGFPGEDVAQLTQGIFNFRPCETFMDSYTQELGEDFIIDLTPVPPLDVLRTVLGEE